MHSIGKVSNVNTADPDRILKFMNLAEYEDRRSIHENDDILV